MSFDQSMKRIAEDVNIKDADRRVYTEDFQKLRDYIMEILKRDRVFKSVFGGCNLFGSYLDKIKVGKPDEFDVHFEIKLPHHELIEHGCYESKPGFVALKLTKVLTAMGNNPNEHEIYNVFKGFVDENFYLKRQPFREWLHRLFESGLKYGCTYGNYKLTYTKCGTAFTINATSNERQMKIDLVPGFQFNNWVAKKPCPYSDKKNWFAVAKPKNDFAFSICAPQVEERLLSDKHNLKDSLRLIKSLKIREEMPRLKSFFIKTVYLWEMENVSDSFWDNATGYLFVHMLGKLCDFMESGKLPFYWDNRQNLLSLLSSNEIRKYAALLKEEHRLFSIYRNQNTSYQTLLNRFSV